MRNQLQAFEPTEQEFKAIFALQKASDDKLGINSSVGASPTDFAAQRDAQMQVDAQIKTLLGDARYAEYKRASDPDYKRLYQIANRLDLPVQKAVEAYDYKTNIDQQLAQIRRDPAKDPAARTAAINALNQNAQDGLTQILGSAGFEAYKTYGSLMRRLQPPPPRPAPKS
jgi:hypothetical protein